MLQVNNFYPKTDHITSQSEKTKKQTNLSLKHLHRYMYIYIYTYIQIKWEPESDKCISVTKMFIKMLLTELKYSLHSKNISK